MTAVAAPIRPGRASRVVIGLASLLTLSAVTAMARSSALAVGGDRQPAEELRYLPRPALLRVVSLRHHELVADLLWMKSVVYFGEMFMHPTRESSAQLERYLDALLAVDPWFQHVYRWAGTMFIYRTGRVTRSDVFRANRFLERGAERFPRDSELWFILGTNYLFEIRPKDEVERRRFRRLGATAIARAADLPEAPEWVATLAATLFQREGELVAAIQLLERSIAITPEARRPALYGKLAQLRSAEASLRVERETNALERSWRTSFPYLPVELFTLVGPEPPFLRPKDLARTTYIEADDLPAESHPDHR